MSTETELKEYHRYLAGRSKLAERYRSLLLYPKVKRHLPGRVLDIGCGIGDYLAFDRAAVGADINPFNVETCTQRGMKAVLVNEPPYPLPAGSFDGVVLDNVLEHLVDPFPILHEARRLLRDGGVILVGVPGEVGYRHDSDHKIFYDEPGLRACLSQARFSPTLAFSTPVNLRLFSRLIRQYCLYVAAVKPANHA